MNLCVEKLVLRLISSGPYQGYPSLNLDFQDLRTLRNFSVAISNPKGLTVKQRSLILRICNRYKDRLELALGPDVIDVLKNEVFCYPLNSNHVIPKQLYIQDDKIILKLPYDEELLKKLREYRNSDAIHGMVWDSDNKSWSFDLNEPNLVWLRNNLNFQEFEVSETVQAYLTKIDQVIAEAEQHIPILTHKNGQYRFENVFNKIPQPTSNSSLENLFLARTYGITVWDENVQKLYENEGIWPLTDDFLKENDKNLHHFSSSIYDIDQFSDLFKFYIPCIILIPGHDELSFLKTWYTWLKTQNFEGKNISVMFRLSNMLGKDFNDYVKENNLNNPLTDHTKVVFISQKVPKPVLKSGINFKFILNLGDIMGTHYTMSNFLSNNETIMYSSRKR